MARAALQSQSIEPGLVAALQAVVGRDGVITEPGRLLSYETDALARHVCLPRAVVLPADTEQAAQVVRLLVEAGVPITPRGAGTGLSGGSVASEGGALVGTSRMNRILSLNPERRVARVQAGVINSDLSAAARPHGLHYPPDPSSQAACTLGGNVGENAGGPHCLKYGVTTRYVTGLTLVTGHGEVLELGGADAVDGLDLVGLVVGSEGRLGLVTEVEVRLLPVSGYVETLLAIFPDTAAAGSGVSRIIAAGLLPAALEIMDRATIEAVEASVFAAGYPQDAGAVLVAEFDGSVDALEADALLAEQLCREAGATELRRARDEAERQALWQGRKKAYGAFGRITPDLMVQDGTVPRSVLPQVLEKIEEVGRRYKLRLANVFHAGDGNLHPKILYDRRDPELVERVEAASSEIMRICVDAGGTITGEHGVGLDKRGYMTLVHGPRELAVMRAVQAAFDPAGRWNPGKMIPEPGEAGAEGAADAGPPTLPHSFDVPREVSAEVSHEASPEVYHAVDHRPDDLTVTVDGHMPLDELQRELARAGQWLPVDPAAADISVEELVLQGWSGALAPALGGIRDHLLGLSIGVSHSREGEAEGSRGTSDASRDGALHLGGRVMKNVAGLDLVRAVVGSRGRLGRVASATFRLLPLPAESRTLSWRFEQVSAGDPAEDQVLQLVRDLVTHPVLPDSVAVVQENDGYRVALRLLGQPATVAAAAQQLASLHAGCRQDATNPASGTFVRGDAFAAIAYADSGGGSQLPRVHPIETGDLRHGLAGLADRPSNPAVRAWLPLWNRILVWHTDPGASQADSGAAEAPGPPDPPGPPVETNVETCDSLARLRRRIEDAFRGGPCG